MATKKKTAKRTTKKKAVQRVAKKIAVKKNPTKNYPPKPRFWLMVKYPKNLVRYYDGIKLTPNKSQSAYFDNKIQAIKVGHALAEKIRCPVSLQSNYPSLVKISLKKKVKTNPAPLSSKARLNQAANLYGSFTGHDAGYIDKINLPIVREVVRVGPCDGILYNTIRDGKPEKYIHKFKKSARPLLVSSFDGCTLYLIGGSYKFTERGIIDR